MIREITLREAKLAEALRYLRTFPGAPAARNAADRLLALYPAEDCAEVIYRGRKRKGDFKDA